MATISLTLPLAGTVVTAGLHSTNYTAIQGAINGGLDTANWATGRIFAPSKIMQEGAVDRDTLVWDNANTKWAPVGAWAAYTPSWTSSGTAPALLNGTLTGRFIQIGKTVQFQINMTAGSTTTFGTGAYSWTLPVTANAAVGVAAKGTSLFNDASPAASYLGLVVLATTTTLQVYPTQANAIAVAAAWGQLVPVTWAVNDSAVISGTYEAA